MWTTDFVDRARADAVLDAQPLYAFPRDERIFRAVSASQRERLDAGIADAVRALDAPVLVVHGEHDTDPARMRAVAGLAPHGRFVEIAGAAHAPWLERPEALRAALRAFLAELR
jgi:pimeloyl-ACP methyl ester carboxylesterase